MRLMWWVKIIFGGDIEWGVIRLGDILEILMKKCENLIKN